MVRLDVKAAIQAEIDAAIGDGMGMIVGIVSPLFGPDPVFMFGGASTMKNSQGELQQLTEATPFEIASITKTFTSTLFMVNHQYDAFTQPLGAYLPDLPLPASLADREARYFANYSSGLAPDNGQVWYQHEDLVDVRVLSQWLCSSAFPPEQGPALLPAGECYSYSNLGWGLLSFAAISARVEDPVRDRYGDALLAMIKTLGLAMPDTQLFEPDIVPSLPMGFYAIGEPFPADQTYNPVAPYLTNFGSGSIVSTGADMVQWLLFNMGRLEVSQSHYPMLAWQQGPQWSLPAYPDATGKKSGFVTGLAWFHGTAANGSPFVWKDGQVAGFSSWIGFKQWTGETENPPPSDIGIVVLTSGDQGGTVGPKILDILLPQATPDTRTSGAASGTGIESGAVR